MSSYPDSYHDMAALAAELIQVIECMKDKKYSKEFCEFSTQRFSAIQKKRTNELVAQYLRNALIEKK